MAQPQTLEPGVNPINSLKLAVLVIDEALSAVLVQALRASLLSCHIQHKADTLAESLATESLLTDSKITCVVFASIS